MKKTIITSALLLCAALGFSQPAPVRTAPTPEQVAQREANALSERLSLTEDQRSKAYSIYLDKAKKDIAAREARIKEMDAQRERAATEQKQQHDKISQLLNADQKKTFEDIQKRFEGRDRGPAGAPGLRQGPRGGLGFRPGPDGAPGLRQGPQGGRGPGDQLRGPDGAPGMMRQGPQGGRGPADQLRGPDGQRPGFQRGPVEQFRTPGAPGLRPQSGPDGRIQRRNMSPNLQDRLNGRSGFQRGPLKAQIFRNQLHRKLQLQKRNLQKRTKLFQRQKDIKDIKEAAPDTKQAKPADSK